MHLYHLAPTGTGEADSEARPVVVHPQCSLLRLENTRGLNSAKRPPSATRSIRNSGRDFRSSRLPPSSHASNRGQAGKWLLAVIGFVVLLVAFASILQLGGGFGEPAPIDDGCDDPSGLGSSARSYDDAPGAVRCLEISDVTEDSIALTWFPPINAGSVGVDHYEVKRAIRLLADERSTVTSTSYIESGLDSATEYRYTVRAFSIDGSRGPEITIDVKTLDPVDAITTSTTPATDAAPGAVPGLEVAAATADSITLTWDPPLNRYTVPVDRYEVIRSVRIFGDERQFVTETTFTDIDLDPDSKYEYRVRAHSADGVEGSEVTVEAFTLEATTTATAPGAAPGAVPGLEVAAATADSITLTWDPPLNRYTVPVDRYEVIRSVRIFGDERQFVTETTFTDIDLDPDSKYEYRVRAHSADGVEGSEVTVEAFTLEATTTATAPGAAPGAVPGLEVAAATADSITLTWDPPLNRYTVPVDRYEVIRSVRIFGDERQFVTETTFTDIDLDPDSKYEYRVRAHSADGVEGSEVTVEAFTLEATTTATAPGAAPGAVPGLEVAAATADSITLTWDPPLNRYTVPVDRYEVIRSVRIFGDERQFVTETTFTDIDLDPDSKYEYRVRAHSADGVEGSEVTVEAFTLEATTTATAPGAAPGAVPGLEVAAATADSITLTWDPPLNRYTVPVDRYEVIRSVRIFGDERQFVTETTFTDIDLDPDSKYEYRVRAHSADGVEGSEVTVEAFTLEATTTATAPGAAPGAVPGLEVAAASG